MRYIIFLLITIRHLCAFAQYPPAAGLEGSNAIHKDSTIIIGWATDCQVQRGFLNISDTTVTYTEGSITSNKAFFGEPDYATGYSGATPTVVSLGDGGSAILQFEHPIKNGEGPDFAVFENTLKVLPQPYQYFIELGFVEVSSDGLNYFRFPSFSTTQTVTQISSFAYLLPQNIHNLAGKYEAGYGTPFDLDELSGETLLDIDNITHVKIIDVVGNINDDYTTYDSEGSKINDPWPTPFPSCGFDLDGVGVIHFNNDGNSIAEKKINELIVYPNPVKAGGVITIKNTRDIKNASVRNISGKNIDINVVNFLNRATITLPVSISPGIYFLQISNNNSVTTKKIVITE